jgi:arylsulfatase A-like enzyme
MSRAAALLAACFAAVAGCSSEPPAPARPATTPDGLVVIVIDTLRADHLGAYGDTRGLSPRLDAMAAEATVYEQCIAASSWTRSSMAALFASEYPTALGVLDTGDVLPESVTTLAESLSAAGYQTLGATANRNAGPRWGFGQGFEILLTNMERVSYPDDFGMVPAEVLTAQGLELLDGRDTTRPFLLFVHYTDPHDPYFAHPEFMPGPEPAGGFDGSRRDLRRMDAQHPSDLTDADKERIRWLYASEVAYCDQWVGALFDGLAERGLSDETLVVVTADHGEGLWDHEKRAHGKDLYEEMIRVPLLVRWPASWGVAPGRVPSPVQNLDVAPTLMLAAGQGAPDGWRGVDLWPVAAGAAPAPRPHAYSEMDLDGIDLESLSDGDEKLIRMRTFDGDKWKDRRHRVTIGDSVASLSLRYFGTRLFMEALVAGNPELSAQGVPADEVKVTIGQILAIPDRPRPDGTLFELYALDADPGEQADQSAEAAARGSALHRAMAEIARRNMERGIEPSSVNLDDLDPEMIEDLKGMGYIGGEDG